MCLFMRGIICKLLNWLVENGWTSKSAVFQDFQVLSSTLSQFFQQICSRSSSE